MSLRPDGSDGLGRSQSSATGTQDSGYIVSLPNPEGEQVMSPNSTSWESQVYKDDLHPRWRVLMSRVAMWRMILWLWKDRRLRI